MSEQDVLVEEYIEHAQRVCRELKRPVAIVSNPNFKGMVILPLRKAFPTGLPVDTHFHYVCSPKGSNAGRAMREHLETYACNRTREFVSQERGGLIDGRRKQEGTGNSLTAS